jgi:hypothetical protein
MFYRCGRLPDLVYSHLICSSWEPARLSYSSRKMTRTALVYGTENHFELILLDVCMLRTVLSVHTITARVR